jgi:hypothetical protein
VALWLVTGVVIAAAGCDSDTPKNPVQPSTQPSTQPSPGSQPPPSSVPPASTRILRLNFESGIAVLELDFGGVEVGRSTHRYFLICNAGNDWLTIQKLSGPDGFWAQWSHADDWDHDWHSPIQPGECVGAAAHFVPRRIGRYEGSLTVTADHTAGNNTIRVVGMGTAAAHRQPLLTIFGEGYYVVGLDIAPGRYHANPNGQCAWWRASKHPAEDRDDDVVARDTTWYDPEHWVVDIPSDAVFNSEAGCGWWDQWPGPKPPTGTIPHGVWEVNQSIQPGRYQTEARPGCRWERLRHFQGTPQGVIERQEPAAGTIVVNLLKSDAGFLTSPECGVWTRTQ